MKALRRFILLDAETEYCKRFDPLVEAWCLSDLVPFHFVFGVPVRGAPWIVKTEKGAGTKVANGKGAPRPSATKSDTLFVDSAFPSGASIIQTTATANRVLTPTRDWPKGVRIYRRAGCSTGAAPATLGAVPAPAGCRLQGSAGRGEGNVTGCVDTTRNHGSRRGHVRQTCNRVVFFARASSALSSNGLVFGGRTKNSKCRQRSLSNDRQEGRRPVCLTFLERQTVKTDLVSKDKLTHFKIYSAASLKKEGVFLGSSRARIHATQKP